jgi:uncharacterized membrane-anchored protein YhcB (DUF1043 family)
MLVAGGVGILLAGVGIGYWFASSRVQIRIAEAEEIRDKFEAYRRDVTEHFGRTAEHFQAIGKQYRELYEHLASGADSFCDTDTLDEKLVYEPSTAIGTSGAGADEPATERPRDYAEGDFADDDGKAEVAASEPAGEPAGQVAEEVAEEQAGTGEEEPGRKAAAEDTASDEEAQQADASGGNGTDTAGQKRHTAEAAHDSAEATVDDLKPEVKSDAEEKSSQPTLH